jgi:hypothetical protein
LKLLAGGEVQTALGHRWLGPPRGPYLVKNGSEVSVIFSAYTRRTFKGAASDPPSNFTSPTDYNASLLHNANGAGEGDDTYTLTEHDTGLVFIFFGLNETAVTHPGRIKERTTRAYKAAGKTGTTYTYEMSGYVSKIVPADPQGALYELKFTYYTSGAVGRLERIELKFGSIPATRTTIAKVEYTYRLTTGNDDLGSSGDLTQVKVSHKASFDYSGSSFSIVRFTQYRYYPSGGTSDGQIHQLKAVYEADAIERIINYDANDSIDSADDLLAMADLDDVGGSMGGPAATDLNKFASRSFTYYTTDESTSAIDTDFTSGTSTEDLHDKYGGTDVDEQYHLFKPGMAEFQTGLVKSETINGPCASCSSQSTESVIKKYYYLQQRGWLVNLTDPTHYDDEDRANGVGFIIVEDTVGGGTAERRRLIGINYNGIAIREALLTAPLGPADSTNIWCRSQKLNAKWRTIERRMPSAHKGVVVSDAKLKEFLDPYDPNSATNYNDEIWSNDVATVSSNAGVVYFYEYDPSHNGSSDYPTGIRVRGIGSDSGNKYYISATDWSNQGANGAINFRQTATYSYPSRTTSRSDTSRITTSYAYTFWDSDKTALKKKTTTLPLIGNGLNGTEDQNGSAVATTTEEFFDKLGRLRWMKNGEGYSTYTATIQAWEPRPFRQLTQIRRRHRQAPQATTRSGSRSTMMGMEMPVTIRRPNLAATVRYPRPLP